MVRIVCERHRRRIAHVPVDCPFVVEVISIGHWYWHLKTHELKELEVNYLTEASYDDEILVGSEKKEASHFFHSLIRNRDNTELCRARTAWESKSK